MKTQRLSQKKRRKDIMDTIGTIVVWIFVILALFPIVWMAITSLMTQGDIATGKFGIPNNFGNYKEMWESVDFFNYFKIVLSCVVLQLQLL